MLLTIADGALLAWWRNDEGVAQGFLAMLFAYCVVAGIGLALRPLNSTRIRSSRSPLPRDPRRSVGRRDAVVPKKTDQV